MDFTKQNFATGKAQALQYDQGLRSFMLNVYNYMAAALVLTGIVAMFAASSDTVMKLLYTVHNGRMSMSGLGWLVSLAPIGLVFALSAGLHRMSVQTAQMLFWSYAALLGLSLSSLFMIFTNASIARVFFITASVFGAMSIYGYTTKRDLTNMGSFLMMGLIGIVFAALVNIFLKSSGLQFAVSLLTVVIFVGLTAYDTQKLKITYSQFAGMGEATAKVAIMGALSLYMDFINIFVTLLQFFGDRRN